MILRSNSWQVMCEVVATVTYGFGVVEGNREKNYCLRTKDMVWCGVDRKYRGDIGISLSMFKNIITR